MEDLTQIKLTKEENYISPKLSPLENYKAYVAQFPFHLKPLVQCIRAAILKSQYPIKKDDAKS